MRYPTLPGWRAGLTVCSILMPALHAHASGFALPEMSMLGLGLSNAVVANAEEHGAVAYNPAAAGFHEATTVSAGALLIAPDLSVTPTSGIATDSEGDDLAVAPSLIATTALNDNWRLGLWVGAPFGLETDWPAGTFVDPAASAALQQLQLGSAPTTSSLELLSIAPSLAYRVSPHLSIAVGADYYHVRDVQLDTAASSLRGDGETVGWNLSALYRADAWSFGVSYRSAATVGVTGDFSSPSLPVPGPLASRADLEIPSRLQAGVRYAYNDRLAVEADITRTGWSAFEGVQVQSQLNGTTVVQTEDQWKDANAYRLGLTWQWNPALQLRFGYSYDETGQPDEHFSARTPDADRQLFSAGFAYGLTEDWTLEGGYMYVLFDDRRMASTVDQSGTDPNGTSTLNGDYSANVHLFGLGIRKTF